MEDLIKALQIFAKYENHKFPTHCEHDILYVQINRPENISESDIKELSALSFDYSEDIGAFTSYRFGSF